MYMADQVTTAFAVLGRDGLAASRHGASLVPTEAPPFAQTLALRGRDSRLSVAIALDDAAGDPHDSPIWHAVAYIGTHFTRSLRVREIAAAAGVGPAQLARIFRRRFDRSPGDMLRDFRVAWATLLLSESELSVSEVAMECGFSDQPHLTRVFLDRIGTTPGRFRNVPRTRFLTVVIDRRVSTAAAD